MRRNSLVLLGTTHTARMRADASAFSIRALNTLTRATSFSADGPHSAWCRYGTRTTKFFLRPPSSRLLCSRCAGEGWVPRAVPPSAACTRVRRRRRVSCLFLRPCPFVLSVCSSLLSVCLCPSVCVVCLSVCLSVSAFPCLTVRRPSPSVCLWEGWSSARPFPVLFLYFVHVPRSQSTS